MFTLKRNQVIITALVVMIAVAGYLNYMDGRNDDTPAMARGENSPDISAIIPGDEVFTALALSENAPDIAFDHSPLIASASNEADYLSEPGEAIFVSAATGATYFVQAKLNREQTRATERDILSGIINNDNVDAAQKAAAADSMLEIQRRIEHESAAESLIEAKGFSEVYVRIDDDCVDVVVSKEALTDAEVAIIEDIVKRKTGFSSTQIHISPMRRNN